MMIDGETDSDRAGPSHSTDSQSHAKRQVITEENENYEISVRVSSSERIEDVFTIDLKEKNWNSPLVR